VTEILLPDDFVLGVATSAYQVEGAAHEDGKGASIWDVFTRTPGKTIGDVPGDAGVDHYHRLTEDIGHMRRLGVDSYRFSLSWPRLLPNGTGTPNQAGIDFYDRLIDQTLAAGIRPHVTLYHWDLPHALQERGGWPNRDVIGWFEDYARLAFDRFGDRVTQWTTLNEPIALWMGYGMGVFAPGEADPVRGKQAMHNAMVAHGRAVQAYRESGCRGDIGIVVDVWRRHPATGSRADRDLALAEEDDSFRFFFDELFGGGWSARLQQRLDATGLTPMVEDGDFATARAPLDFIGLNVYSRIVVRATDPRTPWWTSENADRLPGGNYLSGGREFYPAALSDALAVLRDEYGVTTPVYITENGVSGPDETPGVDGRVHDADRITYLSGFLAEAEAAARRGLGVKGFYAWSLLDNYEWAAAYTEKFGLLHVDLETMQRTWKDSADWYARVCHERRFAFDHPEILGPTSGLPIGRM